VFCGRARADKGYVSEDIFLSLRRETVPAGLLIPRGEGEKGRKIVYKKVCISLEMLLNRHHL
jgi:hypothetical protein